MKKVMTVVVALVLIFCTGCAFAGIFGNKDFFDTVYTFDYAIIQLPNGEVVEGKVQSWRDYEDADQLQIKIDGKIYLVHASQATLIADAD